MGQDIQKQSKEWYIQVGTNREGPFSVSELRSDLRITPDTLVWKEGFADWVPIKLVWELRDLFSEVEGEGEGEKKEEPEEEFCARISPEGLVIDMRGEEPPTLMWILVVLLALLYFLYKLV
ncbi:Uncharacterized protein SCG7086_AA_00370 [Chlamydiales bacterium SCGC AG-110-P3]|nr:Uncharacterized protein SCG7086_AA_00370 [Chlamydiales bacterium SCGC AG-110-P3]